jgi:hypothetical protein
VTDGTTAPNGWRVVAINDTDSSGTITVYVICAQ